MTDIPPTEIQLVKTSSITTDGKNPNKMTKTQLEALKKNIERFGFLVPVVTNKDLVIADGEHRWLAAKELGLEEIPAVIVRVDEVDRRIIRQVMNKLRGTHDFQMDIAEYQFLLSQDSLTDLAVLMNEHEETLQALIKKGEFNAKYAGSTLTNDFIFPPFSVINARTGEWQERKSKWYSILLDTTETREGTLGDNWVMQYINNGVSLFDPVLAEVLYKWFVPEGGLIFDPFAGDTEQGMVAGIKGYRFVGTELRQDQVDKNNGDARRHGINDKVTYFQTDSVHLDQFIPAESNDFIISSPPYYDLEEYSDNPADMSTLSMAEFDKKYAEVIKKAAKTLKPGCFAAYIVGEVRGPKGDYQGLVPKTIQYNIDAGLQFYNEAILVTMIGSLSLRARRPFEASKKLGKTHQNVLIFTKGTPSDKPSVPGMKKKVLEYYDNTIDNTLERFKKGQLEPDHENILIFYKEDNK